MSSDSELLKTAWSILKESGPVPLAVALGSGILLFLGRSAAGHAFAPSIGSDVPGYVFGFLWLALFLSVPLAITQFIHKKLEKSALHREAQLRYRRILKRLKGLSPEAREVLLDCIEQHHNLFRAPRIYEPVDRLIEAGFVTPTNGSEEIWAYEVAPHEWLTIMQSKRYIESCLRADDATASEIRKTLSDARERSLRGGNRAGY